ncbi:MAG: hypothetical protein PHP44_15295 [Kiritimatiellae bacterium]|nr:hypothetical protein [Kiritimatiellia bacterium]
MRKTISVIVAASVFIPAFIQMAGAEPGEGIRINNLTIVPFMDLTAKYDSNIYQTDKNTKDDYIGEGDIGVAVANKTDMLDLGGRLWGQLRRYADHDDKNSDDWGESLGMVLGMRDMIALAIYEKYAQLDDYDRTPGLVDSMNLEEVALELTGDRSEKAKRDVFNLDAGLGKAFTDKLEADAVYKYYNVDYSDAGYYNWNEHRGKADVRHMLTDKTAALLVGIYGVQDSDGFSDKSELGIARLGVEHKLTAKTQLRAEAGYEHYNSGVAGAENKDIFNYMLRGSWAATEKLSLRITGKNGIFPSSIYANNVKEVTSMALGGYLAMTPAIQMALSGSYSEDDYLEKVEVGTQMKDDNAKHYGAQLRVDYNPPVKFFNVYAAISFSTTDSTIEDYDQWKAALGLQLRY